MNSTLLHPSVSGGAARVQDWFRTARSDRRSKPLLLSVLVLTFLLLPSSAFAQYFLPGDEPSGEYPGYWSWQDMVQKFEEYQRAYPALVRMQSIGKTYEGRDIMAVKITSAVDTEDPEKPEVLFMAGIHPREQAPQRGLMRFVDELITGYGTDERASRLLDTRVLWAIPVYNVDGKVYDFKFGDGTTRGANWRTSREPFGVDAVGVDLNRNLPVGWGTASDNPGSQTYHGPAPLSTPESQVLFNFLGERPFRLFLDIHSTSHAYLMPGPKIAEDAEIYDRLTRGLQARQREPYRGNVNRNETQSRALSGTGVGQTHVTGLYMHGITSYIYELGPSNFYAPPDSIDAHWDRNVREAWYYLLEESINLPVRSQGSFTVDNSPGGSFTPGTVREWRPRVEGDVAYGVLVTRHPAIEVTGEFRLYPLVGSGHFLNVQEDAVPGTEVPLQLYLWDRERRRSVIDLSVTIDSISGGGGGGGRTP